MNLQFREITEDNWRKINVQVSEAQQRFVAPYTTTLARAYIYRHYNSMALVIYLNDLPIGVLLQRDYKNEEGRQVCVLDQFFIDQHFQE